MTDKELEKMKTEFFAGEEVPKEFEISHLEGMLKNFQEEKNRVMVNFRMWSYIRDDQRLNQCKTDLKKVRDCIEFVEMRLKELNG